MTRSEITFLFFLFFFSHLSTSQSLQKSPKSEDQSNDAKRGARVRSRRRRIQGHSASRRVSRTVPEKQIMRRIHQTSGIHLLADARTAPRARTRTRRKAVRAENILQKGRTTWIGDVIDHFDIDRVGTVRKLDVIIGGGRCLSGGDNGLETIHHCTVTQATECLAGGLRRRDRRWSRCE